MTDAQILERMGLTDEQLREVLRKFNEFVEHLEKHERRYVLHGLKSPTEAAAELDEDVKPDRLEKFIREHGPKHGIGICFSCDVGHHPPPPPKPKA